VCLFFCHYPSVVALLEHEAVGVGVLSRLSPPLLQCQRRARWRAAGEPVQGKPLHGPTPFARRPAITASMPAQDVAPYRMPKRAWLGEESLCHHIRGRAAWPHGGPRGPLPSPRPMVVGARLAPSKGGAPLAPQRPGNAGALEEMPPDLAPAWLVTAADALGLEGRQTPCYAP